MQDVDTTEDRKKFALLKLFFFPFCEPFYYYIMKIIQISINFFKFLINAGFLLKRTVLLSKKGHFPRFLVRKKNSILKNLQIFDSTGYIL
jgi:hypothetical protein